MTKLSGALWWQDGKRKESLQSVEFKSMSNSPVAPSRLSAQISAHQRDSETSVNVNQQ